MAVDLAWNDGLSLTSNRDIATVNDGDQVVSHVAARFKMVLGEDYYDTQKGVPWFDGIFSQATSYEQKSAILRSVILNTPGVRKINTFSWGVNREQNLMVIEYTAETIFSTAIADTVEI